MQTPEFTTLQNGQSEHFQKSLRKEVHKDNIRVTIIEPGLTATELPQHITNAETRTRTLTRYESIKALDSEDIAAAIVYAVSQSAHVNVNEILIRPTEQEG
jgi:NADP-dependent 3-hydroxy acid dehydrogenase YdfG